MRYFTSAAIPRTRRIRIRSPKSPMPHPILPIPFIIAFSFAAPSTRARLAVTVTGSSPTGRFELVLDPGLHRCRCCGHVIHPAPLNDIAIPARIRILDRSARDRDGDRPDAADDAVAARRQRRDAVEQPRPGDQAATAVAVRRSSKCPVSKTDGYVSPRSSGGKRRGHMIDPCGRSSWSSILSAACR